MSEILRYATLDVGGRPSTVLDLNDMTLFTMARDSFQITPPPKQQVNSTSGRRYGGEHQTAETTGNARISWTALVQGATPDECIATVEKALSTVEGNPLNLLLEWRPDGASQSGFHEIRGTAEWKCLYKWVEFAGNQCMQFEFGVPVAPLAQGLPMDIFDGFTVDTRSDYTYDAGSAGSEEVSGGVLIYSTAGEKRAIHTARGYQIADNQQTIKGTPGTLFEGWILGCVLKRISPETWLDAFVIDTSGKSQLWITMHIKGTLTQLATGELPERIKSGVAHWVRTRIEGNVVTVEYWISAPTPAGVLVKEVKYTLKESAERETFGEGVKGYPGRRWLSSSLGATIDEYSVEPYTYRRAELPKSLSIGSIPGNASAKADITITRATEGGPRIWGLIGWTTKPSSGLAQAPFGLMEAEEASNLSGWAEGSAGFAHKGKLLVDASASSSKTYTASLSVDPSLMKPDAFTSEITIEVWARILLTNKLVQPTLILSSRPEDGLSYGSSRYTDEWGQSGKLLTPPKGAGPLYRFTRLGTLRMLVDPLKPRRWLVWLEGKLAEGSAGEWGIDYLVFVPVRSRACSPSSKAHDSSYPEFMSGTSETSKTIRSDLSGLIAKPPSFGHPDHGLGGSLIEFPVGPVQLFVKLSPAVADDPASDPETDEFSTFVTVHAAVTPRWYLTRTVS